MAKVLEELLKSSDPLSDEAMLAVLDAREENTIVDYKAEFVNDDREWLEVTKDVMAFANTEGGYLAFGVRNGTYEQLGVSDATARLLSDPNNLMQKFNRCVEPPFTALRAKSIERNGKTFVVVLVPPSHGHTHVVSKDGVFDHKSGSPKVVLRQGTFYVRRSGANHLGDARDLDEIVTRRINRFRSKLLEGITRVVESPVESEVLVVTQKEDGQGGVTKKLVIEDAPGAIAVKGMTLTVAPKTPEEEVAVWVGMNKSNSKELPSARTIWKWYAARKALQSTSDQKLRVAVFSLLKCAPAFYWLQGCAAKDVKEALIEALEHHPDPESAGITVDVSAFLGKRFHTSLVTRLGSDASRLGKSIEFPRDGPRSLFDSAPRKYGRVDRPALGAELDAIARSAEKERDGQPANLDRWRALKLDGFLYAQDQYGEAESEGQSET